MYMRHAVSGSHASPRRSCTKCCVCCADYSVYEPETLFFINMTEERFQSCMCQVRCMMVTVLGMVTVCGLGEWSRCVLEASAHHIIRQDDERLSASSCACVHARNSPRILGGLRLPIRSKGYTAHVVLLLACSHHELSIFRWPRRRESGRRLHRSEGARCNARRCSPAKQLTLRRRSTVRHGIRRRPHG
jgi:hypothetical protein